MKLPWMGESEIPPENTKETVCLLITDIMDTHFTIEGHVFDVCI